jgi:hypothetical protein
VSTIALTSLSVVQGDTGKWSMALRDEVANAAIDLTGCSLRMAVYRVAPLSSVVSDAGAEAVLTSPSSGIVITDAAAGEVEITVADSITSGLEPDFHTFDVQLTNASNERYTVARGYLQVLPQTTHNA